MAAKHRLFHFELGDTLPDQGLVPIATDDAFFLGALSGRACVLLGCAARGRLENCPLQKIPLASAPQSAAQPAARFTGQGRWKFRLPELLATLATLGRARRLDDGMWMG